MNIRVFCLVLAVASLVSNLAIAEEKEQFGIKIAEMISLSVNEGQELAYRFNFERTYVIAMNTKIPNSETLKSDLLAKLAKTRRFQDEVLFHPFTPTDLPETIEIAIGSRVPVAAAQCVLLEFGDLPNFKPVLTVMRDNDSFGNTQRIYIGGLRPQGQTPISRKKLKLLLTPNLSQREFLTIIESDR
jgi:hypothetical protein